MNDRSETSNYARKFYAAPLLVTYGSLTNITQAVAGTSQKNDNVNSSLKTA